MALLQKNNFSVVFVLLCLWSYSFSNAVINNRRDRETDGRDIDHC